MVAQKHQNERQTSKQKRNKEVKPISRWKRKGETETRRQKKTNKASISPAISATPLNISVVELGLHAGQLLAQPDGFGLGLTQGSRHVLKFSLWGRDTF